MRYTSRHLEYSIAVCPSRNVLVVDGGQALAADKFEADKPVELRHEVHQVESRESIGLVDNFAA